MFCVCGGCFFFLLFFDNISCIFCIIISIKGVGENFADANYTCSYKQIELSSLV